MVADVSRRGGIRRGCVIGIACALVLLAGCVSGASPRGSTATTTLRVGDRPVLLYVPTSRQPGPAALVVVLHGYTAEAAAAVEFFGLRPLADQRGFVIAAPQGTIDSEGRTFWNASRACCNFDGSKVDDSGHLSRVIAAVVLTQGIDPSRVYVVGHSNGGFMAHRLGCEHADQVAAIASLAGAMDADAECAPTEPVSVLQIHGKADDTILYDGGAIDGKRYTSAADTVALWRRADGCPVESRSGAPLDADANVAGDDLTPTLWATCRSGTEVALWTIADGSHSPALTPAFAAALFDWFEAHQRAS